jgi:hypothetical protein
LNDGSCIRLRPQHRNHVWGYDFVDAQTHDGRSVRLLVMLDEFTRECLAIRVARRLNSAHVIEMLGDCMLAHGMPEHVHHATGPGPAVDLGCGATVNAALVCAEK